MQYIAVAGGERKMRMDATSKSKSGGAKAVANRSALFRANHEASGNNPQGATSIYIEEIQIRAETVTPVLKEFLDLRPAPHWD